MSVAILDNRKSYYQILEQSQSFDTLDTSLNNAINTINGTLFKIQFWQRLHLKNGHNSGLSVEK